MHEPILTETEFGESDFGKRLNYDRPKYRDPVFAVLYILHVIGVLVAGIYIWVKEIPDITDETNNTSLDFDINITSIVLAVCACVIVGILFGLCWLQVMKRFAMVIIKAMLFCNIGMWIVVALVGVALLPDGFPFIIIGGVLALIYGIWTLCIWRRIPFASALLNIASAIISRHPGTIFISLSVIVFNILWIIVWGSCMVAYFVTLYTNKTVTNPDGTTSNETFREPNPWIIFLLLVSLYWGIQVNKNVSHTTTCGVAATWYFSTVIDHKPTAAAFKRTMTTSFGSVCLGSLIVAILQAIRAMARSARRGRNAVAMAIAMCLLYCIEWMIRYFNKYAYAQCAIYGTSFIESAKATWNLFTTRGILALINDDLTGLAILCGSFIGGIFASATGFGIGYAFYSTEEDGFPEVPIFFAIYGFVVGFVLCHCVLMVLASAVIALFVCYAEDPAAMNQNRPEEYTQLNDAKPQWGQVFTQFNTAPRAPIAAQPQPTIVQTTKV